jgi:hypothetical protein
LNQFETATGGEAQCLSYGILLYVLALCYSTAHFVTSPPDTCVLSPWLVLSRGLSLKQFCQRIPREVDQAGNWAILLGMCIYLTPLAASTTACLCT